MAIASKAMGKVIYVYAIGEAFAQRVARLLTVFPTSNHGIFSHVIITKWNNENAICASHLTLLWIDRVSTLVNYWNAPVSSSPLIPDWNFSINTLKRLHKTLSLCLLDCLFQKVDSQLAGSTFGGKGRICQLNRYTPFRWRCVAILHRRMGRGRMFQGASLRVCYKEWLYFDFLLAQVFTFMSDRLFLYRSV